jgi:predicted PurR-regulated permease PerM
VIAASLLFYHLLKNIEPIRDGIQSIFRVCAPLTIGLILAYLLNPIQRLYELNLFYPLIAKKKKPVKHPKKTAHNLAVVATILTFLLMLFLLFYMVLPQLYESMVQLITEMDSYYTSFVGWMDGLLTNYPEIMNVLNSAMGTVSSSVQDFLKSAILPYISEYMTQVTSGVISVALGIKNVLLGLIFAVYVMLYQNRIIAHCKRILYTIFSTKHANHILTRTREANTIFSGYISGKILDSIIIGVLCLIVTSIFRVPYSLLISVIICITNIIPVFGPVIGAIAGALLLLIVDPWKSLTFIIIVVILQQLDGNVIGPKILGNSTGLNPFWIVVVILVAGGLFGIPGMLVGIPVFAFFYNIAKEKQKQRLDKKNLPSDTLVYAQLQTVDTETGEIVRESRYPTAEELAEHSFKKSFLQSCDKYKQKILKIKDQIVSRFSHKS